MHKIKRRNSGDCNLKNLSVNENILKKIYKNDIRDNEIMANQNCQEMQDFDTYTTKKCFKDEKKFQMLLMKCNNKLQYITNNLTALIKYENA